MIGFFPPKKKGSTSIAIKTKAQGIIIMAIIPPVDNPPELFFVYIEQFHLLKK